MLRESHRPGIEPAACKSQVQRPTAKPPRIYLFRITTTAFTPPPSKDTDMSLGPRLQEVATISSQWSHDRKQHHQSFVPRFFLIMDNSRFLTYTIAFPTYFLSPGTMTLLPDCELHLSIHVRLLKSSGFYNLVLNQ